MFYSKACDAGPSRPALASHFMGMGFSEDMVLKAIKENGQCFVLHIDITAFDILSDSLDLELSYMKEKEILKLY